jgi:hypothetical protein
MKLPTYSNSPPHLLAVAKSYFGGDSQHLGLRGTQLLISKMPLDSRTVPAPPHTIPIIGRFSDVAAVLGVRTGDLPGGLKEAFFQVIELPGGAHCAVLNTRVLQDKAYERQQQQHVTEAE